MRDVRRFRGVVTPWMAVLNWLDGLEPPAVVPDAALEALWSELGAEVLEVLAPQGCSEHHAGRAVDIRTPGFAGLDEAFEGSPAFSWLERHAEHFGFMLSFPRDNRWGYRYEPWHWCHQGAGG